MRVSRRVVGRVASLMLLCAAAAQAQDAVLARASPLLAAPAPKADTVAKLPANTALSVLERKGGWYKVRGPGGEEGWVKLFAVSLTARPGGLQEGDDSSGAAGAALSGAAGGGAGTAAAGALGSMMTGSSADSTAVRGAGSGKVSGKKLVDPAKAEAGAASSIEQMGGYVPSDEDMKAFEEGMDDESEGGAQQ